MEGILPEYWGPILWQALLIINVATFLLCAYDKAASKAGNPRIRVSEKRLFAAAFLMGAAGVYGAMLLLRHKTRHKSFMTLVPAALVLELLAALWLLGPPPFI